MITYENNESRAYCILHIAYGSGCELVSIAIYYLLSTIYHSPRENARG